MIQMLNGGKISRVKLHATVDNLQCVVRFLKKVVIAKKIIFYLNQMVHVLTPKIAINTSRDHIGIGIMPMHHIIDILNTNTPIK